MAEDGVDNAYESEKKSRDVKRGLAANKRAGMPHGICKYGYERIHDPKTGALTGQRPVPAHAAICAEIITRIASGEPVSAIRDDLESRKVPPPNSDGWYRRTVRRIATSVAYIGKIKVDGELIDAVWEPVIDDDTFWAAQHVLTAPGRKTTKPGKAKYLLSYIMSCECGKPLQGDSRKVPIYHCPDWHAQIVMTLADAFVTTAVKRRVAQPDFYNNLTSGSGERIIRREQRQPGCRQS